MTDSGRDIPEYVLFDILVWLPVVSLLRFKCVCKSWCALVESSTFITEHLHRSNSSEDALIAYGEEISETFVYSADFNERSLYDTPFLMLIQGNQYQKCFKLDYMQKFFNLDYIRCVLVSSCDGIVCMRTIDIGGIALWNPAMKQIRHLPKPSFPTPPVEEVNRFAGWDFIGFGFDFKTNDYKVVRVLTYADEPGSRIHNMKIVEVYSKRADSWRTLHKKGASLPFKSICPFIQPTNKNGTCFWIGRGFDDTGVLVSFDLNAEVFETMSLPDYDLSEKARALDFLNDNLVYTKSVDCNDYEAGYKFFEIWMLHEFGIKESWSKLYKIGPIFQKRSPQDFYYYPIIISKNGEFVVLKRDCGGELHLYNLRVQDNKCPLILPPGPLILPPRCLANELLHYKESLVSVTS